MLDRWLSADCLNNFWWPKLKKLIPFWKPTWMVIVTHTLEHLFCICVGYERSDVSTTRVLKTYIVPFSIFYHHRHYSRRGSCAIIFDYFYCCTKHEHTSISSSLSPFILQHSIYALWSHNCVYSIYALWVWSRCLKTLCILAANFRVEIRRQNNITN